MSFTPIAWRHAFPSAEGTTKRVRIFEPKQIRGLIQLQDGIGEVVPSHLVPGFIQDTLEARAGFLQSTLQRTRAHVQRLGDHIH